MIRGLIRKFISWECSTDRCLACKGCDHGCGCK